MSSLDNLLTHHVEKVLAHEFKTAQETPMPVTPEVSVPPRTEPPTTTAAPPTEDHVAKLTALVEAQNKKLAEFEKRFKAVEPPPAPAAPRTTVKSLEQQVAELSEKLSAKDELDNISRELPTLPEYATLKSLPNLADLVRTTIREEKRAARERGEGENAVTVAQAVKRVKEAYIADLKQHLANQELLREIGLSAPASAPPANSGRAVTSDLTSHGAATPVNRAGSLDDLIQQQIKRAMSVLG